MSDNGSDRNSPRRDRSEVDGEISLNAELAAPEARAVLNHIKYAAPFIILFFLRFLFTHALRILFLLALCIFQYRICHSFNDQVALKGSSSKKAFWFIFWTSVGILSLVHFLTPSVFAVKIWPRFIFRSYDEPNIDFLGVLWITLLTDMSFKIGLITLQSACCILLPTYSTQPDSYQIISGDMSPMAIFRLVPLLRAFVESAYRTGE